MRPGTYFTLQEVGVLTVGRVEEAAIVGRHAREIIEI